MAHHFISYSSADGLDFAFKIADALEADEPPFEVWFDKRKLEGGDDWDTQLVEAIKTCDSLLFIMTPDSVEDESVCKQEWSSALKFKRPIIPLKFHPDAELPFRLGNRHYIDFTHNYNQGYARLRTRLKELASPKGLLQALKDRLADANRDLRRAPTTQQGRIKAEIEQLQQEIVEQQRIVDNPEKAAKRTEQSIKRGIERERFPEKPVSGVNRTKFINPPPVVAPAYFQGRTVETGIVAQFLADESTRVITMAGRGGIGKTALVCRLLKALESGKLPDDGVELSVDGIVYLSANGTRRVNLPNIFADLSQFLPEATAADLDALYKNPQVSTAAKMQKLLEHFPNGRFVVLLDNFEDVIDPATLTITDAELGEALIALLNAPHHTVKLIITTRIPPKELVFTQPGRQRRVDLDEGLPSPYAENILREMDAGGRVGLRDAVPALLDAARKRTSGYPRALEALFAILAADRSTTLPEILADTSHILPETVIEALVGEAFSRLDPLGQQVMQSLAIYGRPVSPIAVDHLLQPYVPGIDSAPALNRLVNMRFVSKDAGRYHLHPVDREYALSRIPEGTPEDRKSRRKSRWTQVALLERGADYFKKTRKPRAQWKTLDDLAPQLAEFELRYAGGDYETAANVLFEISFDYLRLWGYTYLLIELHDRLEGKLPDPWQKSVNISNLGLAYRRLGEYHKAIDYHQQQLKIDREIGDRHGSGVAMGSLGLNYFSLGDYKRAIDYYEQYLTIVREVGDRFNEGIALGNLAEVLSEQGRLTQAMDYAYASVTIAEEINDSYISSHTHGYLSRTYMYNNDLEMARTSVETALLYDIPQNNHNVLALRGIIAFRQGDHVAAQEGFSKAIAAADSLLALAAQNVEALDAKALALSGLALIEGPQQHIPAAIEAYREARNVTKAAGIVARAVRLLDALAVADEQGILKDVRAAAAGED
jgi:tetratricopeptide (TPR) repeat protein